MLGRFICRGVINFRGEVRVVKRVFFGFEVLIVVSGVVGVIK